MGFRAKELRTIKAIASSLEVPPSRAIELLDVVGVYPKP